MLLLFMAAQATTPAYAAEVYTCEYLKSESANPHTPPRNDLVITHTANATPDGVWTFTWRGKLPIQAMTFDAPFGSIGGSAAFRWTEAEGKPQVGFLSFSDMQMKDGSRVGWLGLGKPSLWKAPGYICAAPAANDKRAAK